MHTPASPTQPSNGICRSLGYTLIETLDIEAFGQTLRANHWVIDPRQEALPSREVARDQSS
ncbi:MAG: hypothetical protein OEV60_09975 [Actinomycetota bacterium]|nr:hypothetical protein [Actinomycetota bacterium]MDH5223807.1 hypothetical protein [Actinomycetota bacterium]